MINRTIREYEENLASNCKENNKAFFSYVKQNSQCAETISILKGENNIWVKDDIDKANVLNRYFKSVFVRDDNSNPSVDYTCETEFDISEDLITEDIVLEKLGALKTDKSAGPDGFNPKFLFEMKAVLAKPVTSIFRKSLKQGRYPRLGRRLM